MKKEIIINNWNGENPLDILFEAYRQYFIQNRIGNISFWQLKKDKKMPSVFKVPKELLLALKWRTTSKAITFRRDRIFYKFIPIQCVDETKEEKGIITELSQLELFKKQ